MIIIDLIHSYIISIVLLVITYVYLAETKSILQSDTSLSSPCDSKSNTYLIYTTGTCFKYYKFNNNNLFDRESLRKVINLTDCESSTEQQLYTKFDHFFDTTDQLNLIVFEKRSGSLFGGRLNLSSSSFEPIKIYGTYANITFSVDRSNKIVYIADREANRIESIDLVSGKREVLSSSVSAPDAIQVQSGRRLVWIEKDVRYENSKHDKLSTCFYEWSIKEQKQKRIGCVNERVQSFELNSFASNIFYITKDGSLYLIDSRSTNDAVKLSPIPIYKPKKLKRKYQIQIFKFKTLFNNNSSIELFLSDLVHQGIMYAKLNDIANDRPTLLFTDQPSLFDFMFIDLSSSGCASAKRSAIVSGNNFEHNASTINDKPLNLIENEILKDTAEFEDELKKELKAMNDLIEIRKVPIQTNSKNTINSTGNESIDTDCRLLCNTTFFYSIVFIGLIIMLILAALLMLLSKRFERFNVLIDSGENETPTFKRKLFNIHFNIKKTFQTM